MKLCPFAQRAHLVLEAKKIPYHTIWVNMRLKPEWLFEKSPLGKVPALEIPNVKGDPVIESLIIAEYLDDQYPQNPLKSKDPLQHARDRILIDRYRTFMQDTIYHLFFPDDLPNVYKEINKNLDIYEEELKTRGTKFFGGSKPGFVDYMIWPFCERTDAHPYILGENYQEMDKNRHARLNEWKELMKQDPAVQATITPGDVHFKFFESYFRSKKAYYEDAVLPKL